MIIDYTDGSETEDRSPRQQSRDRFAPKSVGLTPSLARSDLRNRRQSWKTMGKIYTLLQRQYAMQLSDNRRADREKQGFMAKARDAKKRFQTFLMNRIERVIDGLKKNRSNPMGGISSVIGGAIAGASVLAALLAMKALTTAVRALRGAALGILGFMRKGAMGILSKGKDLAVRMGRKLMQTRAGALMGAAYNTAKALFTRQGMMALGRRAAGMLTAVMGRALPRVITGVIGGPVGVLAQVGLAAKFVWDAILPDSWKEEISFQVSKYYLKAVKKMTDLFVWLGNYWDGFKKKMSDWSKRLEQAKNDAWDSIGEGVAGAVDFFSFLGSAITSDGPARDAVMEQWTRITDTVFSWFKGLGEWYDDFVAPFYVDGKFSLSAGAKAYKDQYKEWRAGVDDVIGGTIASAMENAEDVYNGVAKKAEVLAPSNLVAAAEREVAKNDMSMVQPKGYQDFAVGDSIDGTIVKKLRLPYDDTTGLVTYQGKNYTPEQLYKVVAMPLTEQRGRQLQAERARQYASQAVSTFKSMTASGVNSAQTWLKSQSLDPMKIFADFFSADRVAKAHQEAYEESKTGSRAPQSPILDSNPQSSNFNGGKAPMSSIVGRPNMSEVGPHVNSFPTGLA